VKDATNLLFSYGTLQLRGVQLDTFGREPDMEPDALPGYVLDAVRITDPHVIAVSGSDVHPFARATDDPADRVEGVVLALTDSELVAADGYEVEDYTRVSVTLASGRQAWIYVDASAAGA
jgi:AIG2-like family.